MADTSGIVGIARRGPVSGFGGVLCIGNIVIDVLVRPVEQIPWGGTCWVDSVEVSLGGNGANTAAAIGMLGVPARLIGGVGKDLFGQMALDRLRSCRVDTRWVAAYQEQATATTVALVRSDGTRAFLHRPGVSRALFAGGLRLESEQIAGCSRLHIANPFAVAHLRDQAVAVLRQARALGINTSLDTAWDALGEWMRVIEPCLPHTQILFTNEDEARMLTGATEEEAAGKLLKMGASTIVIKLGARGCLILDAAGLQRVAGFPVQAVDTTGAGDCFAGAFLAALERGLPLVEAARVANAAGAMNVQALGATAGLRSWEETVSWMARQGR